MTMGAAMVSIDPSGRFRDPMMLVGMHHKDADRGPVIHFLGSSSRTLRYSDFKTCHFMNGVVTAAAAGDEPTATPMNIIHNGHT